MKNFFERLGNWWAENYLTIRNRMDSLADNFYRFIVNTSRFVIIGIIVNIVACHFYPEFPSRFPAIYGWFDGWLQFEEFAVKTALGGIYSLFTGNFSEFCTHSAAEFQELWAQFINWLSQIANL